jgi:hypothetical protein
MGPRRPDQDRHGAAWNEAGDFVIDLRSWPKKWNDSSLRDFAILPESSGSRPWPMLGMLAVGLVAGAALGGYAVSQRNEMKRLAKHAHRMGDELAALGRSEAGEAAESIADVTSPRSNHRRKAASEV